MYQFVTIDGLGRQEIRALLRVGIPALFSASFHANEQSTAVTQMAHEFPRVFTHAIFRCLVPEEAIVGLARSLARR